ncbi:hypothetical protein [Citricoccus sp. GCM10030269]|uniref:hypothetical protein n=1 Tax=Citricoccus sp. GCM10030269 TaxID=3273388 RepID=UPI003620A870
MAQLNRRARYKRKQRWVQGIVDDPRFSLDEKKALLWLSQYADENGNITDPRVNAMIHEAVSGEEGHGIAERR